MRVLEKIKKPDILATVQGFVELRQRGARFWGLCPFHLERTPSFSVDPEKQRWKCFGCGENGDAIDFVRKFKGLSFPEALRVLHISGEASRGQAKRVVDPEKERSRALSTAFDRWCDSATEELTAEIWLGNVIDSLITEVGHLDSPGLGSVYLEREVFEYELSVLTGNDLSAKVELYRRGTLCGMN